MPEANCVQWSRNWKQAFWSLVHSVWLFLKIVIGFQPFSDMPFFFAFYLPMLWHCIMRVNAITLPLITQYTLWVQKCLISSFVANILHIKRMIWTLLTSVISFYTGRVLNRQTGLESLFFIFDKKQMLNYTDMNGWVFLRGRQQTWTELVPDFGHGCFWPALHDLVAAALLLVTVTKPYSK